MAIFKSTIDLAHSLHLSATAEGVDDAATLQLLTEFGCDAAQGYHISKPLTASEVSKWSADWNRRQRPALSHGTFPTLTPSTTAPSAGKGYDGSEETKADFIQSLAAAMNPLWKLGRNSLVGWRPTDGGIDVLMAPYQNIVDCFDDSQRLLHGRRQMGDATFRAAQEITRVRPAFVALRYKIADEPNAVPPEIVEHVLRRYGITETQHRAVALFDIVGFTKCTPRSQIAQLNSLECAISTAQGILQELGRPIDLARTTTGDGFYIWNRDKGPQADLGTYLLTLLVLADNAISRQAGRLDLIPELRTCFTVGLHYSYHQVDGLDPRGHDYIVGDVTIALARMISKCLPGQILIGDFNRPVEFESDPADPLAFVVRAHDAFDRFNHVRLYGRTIDSARCYLTGEQTDDGSFAPIRYLIRDKHGFEHCVYNQRFNIYLTNLPHATAKDDFLYLGTRKAELSSFDAPEAPGSRAS